MSWNSTKEIARKMQSIRAYDRPASAYKIKVYCIIIEQEIVFFIRKTKIKLFQLNINTLFRTQNFENRSSINIFHGEHLETKRVK